MDANVCSTAEGSATLSISSHNQYHTDGLRSTDLHPSPITQFEAWFKEANNGQTKVVEPEAMVVSTCTLASSASTQHIARPSSRVVLLKRVTPQGFVFFTNYTSRKGSELEENPYASATFYWREVHRSVRVLGRVQKVSQEESKTYFDSRPVGSRIGARASPQSRVVKDRAELEALVRAEENKWGVPGAAGLKEGDKSDKDDAEVPLPNYWGGYVIIPDEVEFWVGRPNRLHDRFRYTRKSDSATDARDDKWQIDRLGP